MHEDKLLSRIDVMEAQLEFYMRVSARGAKEAGQATENDLRARLAEVRLGKRSALRCLLPLNCRNTIARRAGGAKPP